MARSRRGSTFFAPMRKKTRFERFKEFVWNSETNQLLGRSGTGWGLIFIFYCCLYTCLGGFFTIMMLGLNASLDEKLPKFIMADSPIGTIPGINVLPRVTSSMDVSPISFKPSDQTTWISFVNQLTKELEPYIDQTETNTIKDCYGGKKASKENGCLFDIEEYLGHKCTKHEDFGYVAGEPCVLLKLNKLIGWEPKSFDEKSTKLNDYKLQRQDQRELNNNYVGITCAGVNAVDKENIGKITFYPTDGFNTKYFPYFNQPGYLSPIVMAQFTEMKTNVLINVECKIWAENIKENRQKKRGFIRFEMKIEE